MPYVIVGHFYLQEKKVVEHLKERLALIEKAVGESATNHNALLVRLDEVKYLLQEEIKRSEQPVETPPEQVVDESVEQSPE